MTVIVPIGGHFADNFRSSGKLTTTQVRKIFNCGKYILFLIYLFISFF